MTVSEHDREKDRWSSVAFIAAGIAGRPAHERLLFLGSLLRAKFSDIPDEQPDPDDVQAYAVFAVKLPLQTLTDDSETMRPGRRDDFARLHGSAYGGAP